MNILKEILEEHFKKDIDFHINQQKELRSLSDLELKLIYTDALYDDPAMSLSVLNVIINKESEKTEKLIIELKELKEENTKMKQHILAQPDGLLYFEAMKHYEYIHK